MADYKEFFLERYGGYAKSQSIWYHGTCVTHLRSIIKQGLLANPPARAWNNDERASFELPSLQSISNNVYVAKNLKTAAYAALDACSEDEGATPTDILIICCQLSNRLMHDDEDVFHDLISSRIGDERQIRKIFDYYINAKTDAHSKTMLQHELNAWKSRIRHQLNMVDYSEFEKYSIDNNMDALFFAGFLRQASHIYDLQQKYKLDPIVKERRYREIIDQLTKRTRFTKKMASIQTARVPQDIKFSGPNKILCIFSTKNFLSYKTRIEPIIHFGTLPDRTKEEIEIYNSQVQQNIDDDRI